MSKEIKIYFSKAKDYKIIPANGAWGGISPEGSIIFDLFIEKNELPDYIELEINDGKGKAKEINKKKKKIVRESQIGIVLKPDIAYSIGEWLIDKAKNAGFTKENRE